jgi:hypothetical protein
LALTLLLLFFGALFTLGANWRISGQRPVQVAMGAPSRRAHWVPEAAAITMTAQVGRQACEENIEDPAVQIGHPIYICYTVENLGDAVLNLHDFVHSQRGQLLNSAVYTLGPGEITTTSPISFVVVAPVTSLATWRAYDVSRTGTATAQVSTPIRVLQPGLAITLTVNRRYEGTPETCPGQPSVTIPVTQSVYYCLQVRNTGAIPLSQHVLTVPQLGINNQEFYYEIEPGAEVLFTNQLLQQMGLSPFLAFDQVPTPFTTTVTLISAESEERPQPQVTASSAAPVLIGKALIDVQKSVALEQNCLQPVPSVTIFRDQAIYYCLVLRNTGEITFTEHTFTEPENNVYGKFTYLLQPGAQLALTPATITTTTGLTILEQIFLGPFFRTVTATDNLLFTSTNNDQYIATDQAAATINVPISPIQLRLLTQTNGSVCEFKVISSLSLGARFWVCLYVTNNASTSIIGHQLLQLITPSIRPNVRYAYTSTVQFDYELRPNVTLAISNPFLIGVVQKLPVMGPFTITQPITSAVTYTDTIIYTGTNKSAGVTLVARATVVVPFVPATATATGTPTTIPTPTGLPTPTPTFTPLGGIPTDTPTPTMTPIAMSVLAAPTPTPIYLLTGVSTPVAAALANTGVFSPTATTIVFTPEPTLTFTPDPLFLAATMTLDAASTETAVATLFTATPTPSDTPTPTATSTETTTASPTASPTATQRPINLPTPTATVNNATFIQRVIGQSMMAAGWIWFVGGTLLFFVSAGIVAGLTFRSQEHRRYQLRQERPLPPVAANTTRPPTPPPSAKPGKPALEQEEDDHWPPSLP